ncbi:MAG: hypothetical protein AB1489_24575 [Acidobacteriota bacterium]
MDPIVQKILNQEAILLDAALGVTAPTEDRAHIEGEWRTWLQTLFPHYCYHPFASHHEDHWNYVWSIKAGEKKDPIVEILSRGHGKSTGAELACVAVGARKTRRCALYISSTKDKVKKHARSIESLLVYEEFTKFYPEMSERQVSKYGHSRGWNGEMLVTASGFVIFFVSLDCGYRGLKWEESRPDLIILDDIDELHDSPATTEKKIETITQSLLPAGAQHAITIFVQNKIKKNSIAARLANKKDGAQFLAKRKVIGPIPAIRNLVYKKRVDGPGYDIISGEPTWSGCDLDVCQAMMDEYGLEGFLRECQHDVERTDDSALLSEFNEIHHIITWSEFAKGYGKLARNPKIARDDRDRPRLPHNGTIGRTQDFGTTVAHPCVTTWAWRPEELMPLAKCVFMYREQCLPEFPNPPRPLIPVSPGRVLDLIHKVEQLWNEGPRIKVSRMSHEQSAAANAYSQDAPEGEKETFHKIKGNRRDGIPQLQNYLAIDYTQPHPFRKYPECGCTVKPCEHPNAGEPINGCPRIFWIVADGQGELYYDEEGNLLVTQPIDSAGQARARYEIPIYKNRVDANGIEIDDPEHKIDDDYVDALKMQARYFFLPIKRASKAARIEATLPPAYKLETIQELSDEEKGEHLIARQLYLDRLKAEKQQQRQRQTPVWMRPNKF